MKNKPFESGHKTAKFATSNSVQRKDKAYSASFTKYIHLDIVWKPILEALGAG